MAQVPKSIKAIAGDIKKVVTDHYPNVICIDDLPSDYVEMKYKQVGSHELFYQDADRYIGDIYVELASKGSW